MDKKKIFAMVLFLVFGFTIFTFANPGTNLGTNPVDKQNQNETDEEKTGNNQETENNQEGGNQQQAAGNGARVNNTILVNPEIVAILVGDDYDVMTGVVATTGTVTATINDTTSLGIGEHVITYSNEGLTATRTLIVLDPETDYDNDGYTNKEEFDNISNPLNENSKPTMTNPIVNLIGEDVIVLERETIYVELGATAVDSLGKSLDVIVTCELDPSTVESYTCTYEATDREGNVGIATRTIIVEDTTAPTGTFTYSNNNGAQVTAEDVIVTLTTDEKIKTPQGWTKVNDTTFTKEYSANGKYSIEIEDLAGNKTTLNYEVKRIDKDAPEFIGLQSNYKKSPVSFSASKTGADNSVDFTVLDQNINSVTFVNKTTGNTVKFGDNLAYGETFTITEEGKYEVTAIDKAENTTTEEFTIDTSKPSITLVLPDKKFYNTTSIDVKVEATDNIELDKIVANLYKVGKEGVFKSSQSSINAVSGTHEFTFNNLTEGKYYIKANALDKAGNISTTITYEFEIDLTLPEVKVNLNRKSYVTTGAVVSVKSIPEVEAHDANLDYFAIYDSEGKQLGGNAYAEGRTYRYGNITHLSNGTYTIYAYDLAGNKSEPFTIVIDSTAPQTEILNPTEQEFVNSGDVSVKVKSTDNYGLSKIVANLYDASNDKLLKSTQVAINGETEAYHEPVFGNLSDGNYYIKANAYDLAGTISNTVIRNFTVDTKAPEIRVKTTEIDGAGFTIGSVSLKTFSKVSFKLFDNNGVKEVLLNGVVKELAVNKWSDYNYIVVGTNNAAVYGENTLVLRDVAGNEATYTFILDNLEPTLTIKEDSLGSFEHNVFKKVNLKLFDKYKVEKVILNGTHTHTVSPNTWSDFNNIAVGVNGGVYGKNTAVLYDVAGNTTTLEFYLDNVNPTLTIKEDSLGSFEYNTFRKVNLKLYDEYKVEKVILNGTHTHTVSPNTWSDFNNIAVGVNGGVYGKNTAVLYDLAGNTTTLEFILDNVAPKIAVKDSSIGDKTLNIFSKVDFKLTDAYKVLETELNGTVKKVTPNTSSDLNNVKVGSLGGVYGENTLILRDVAGNETTFTFTLDNVSPTITIYTDANNKVVLENGSITNATYLNVNIKDDNIGKFYINDKEFTSYEGKSWFNIFWNGAVYNEGKYVIKAVDKAGNETTFTFTIDKSAPKIVLGGGANQGTNAQSYTRTLTVTDSLSGVDESSLKYIWTTTRLDNTDAIVNAINANGISFASGDSVTTPSAEGKYYLAAVAKDNLGNISWISTWAFVVDKTAPIADVTYKNDKILGQTAVVTANESIKITGWNCEDNVCEKTYSEKVNNQDVIVKDLAGNETIVQVTITEVLALNIVFDYSSELKYLLSFNVSANRDMTIKNGSEINYTYQYSEDGMDFETIKMLEDGQLYEFVNINTFAYGSFAAGISHAQGLTKIFNHNMPHYIPAGNIYHRVETQPWDRLKYLSDLIEATTDTNVVYARIKITVKEDGNSKVFYTPTIKYSNFNGTRQGTVEQI